MTNLPSYGIGTLPFGISVSKPKAKLLIEMALECGVTFFDTSPLYGNGHSEQILGAVLPKNNAPLVSTKVGLKKVTRSDGGFGVAPVKLDEKNIRKSVEQSLINLQRDHIDLLQLHAYDSTTPLEETLSALEKLYGEGKINAFGCSNYSPTQARELFRLIRKQNISFFWSMQCHYNVIEQRVSKIFAPLCEKNGAQLIINRALARGALTGQYTNLEKLPIGSRAYNSLRIQKWLTKQRLQSIKVLSEAISPFNVTLLEASLAWLRNKHPSCTILLGIKTPEQLELSLRAESFAQDTSLINTIDQTLAQEQHVFSSPPRYLEK